MGDLFGAAPTPERKGPQARGYIRHPGGGPAGETCGTCRHRVRKHLSGKAVYKCRLTEAAWGSTRRTDILVKAPACEKWEADHA